MAAWKGSAEGDGAEQEHFPVAAQGHALPRERLTIHICSHHFCFIAPFSELPSQDFCHLFFHPHILSFNCFHPECHGGCEREEPGVRCANTKQMAAAAEGLPATTLPSSCCQWAAQACAGTLLALCGTPGPAGTPLLPSSAPVAAACCRGAELRSWRQWHFKHCRYLLSGCESVFNFQALCYLQWLFSNLSVLSFL